MKSLALISLLLQVSCSDSDLIETDFDNDVETGARVLRNRKRNGSGSRIVGGTPAGEGKYPFIVSLYNIDPPDGNPPVCGE